MSLADFADAVEKAAKLQNANNKAYAAEVEASFRPVEELSHEELLDEYLTCCSGSSNHHLMVVRGQRTKALRVELLRRMK